MKWFFGCPNQVKSELKTDRFKMNNNEIKNKIIVLKDKIHDITEYLQSDTCRSCGDAALQIEKYIKELSDLISIEE